MMYKYYKIFFIFLLFLSVILTKGIAEEVLTWQDCIREAAQNHPDLISAQENVKQQKADKAITASELYPQIDSNLDASTAGTSVTDTTTGSTTRTRTDSYTYGVSGTQLIFGGFKKISNVKAALENIKAAQQNYRITSSQVRLNLRTAFINLLKAQELIRVVEDIVKIRKGSLELINLRYESGLEHRGALLTAEANISEANFELAQAKREVSLAQGQLSKEMGRKEFKPMWVKGDFTVCDVAKDKPDLEVLAQNNPSLLQAFAKKNAALFDVKSVYADFTPQLSGEAGANRTSSSWPPRNNNYYLGLSLTLPIFEGGLRLAQVSKAKAVYNQAEANARGTWDDVVANLEETWVALQNAAETVEVRRKLLNAAEERSRIAEAEYSAGSITFDNWIIIQNNLVTAKKTYLNSQAYALLAEAAWIQAKGEILEDAK